MAKSLGGGAVSGAQLEKKVDTTPPKDLGSQAEEFGP